MSKKKRARALRMRRDALTLFGSVTGKFMESEANRIALAGVLIMSSDENMRLFAKAMQAEGNEKRAAIQLAYDMGITMERISHEYEEIRRSEGRLLQSDLIPQTMVDIALDAQTSVEECMECSGTGEEPVRSDSGAIIDKRKCRACRGRGEIRILGDTERLKLFLKNTGLIQDKGGVNVNQQTNIVNTGPKLEDLADILSRRKPQPPLLEGE